MGARQSVQSAEARVRPVFGSSTYSGGSGWDRRARSTPRADAKRAVPDARYELPRVALGSSIVINGESASFGWNNRVLPSADSHANGPPAPWVSRSGAPPSAGLRRDVASVRLPPGVVDPSPIVRPRRDDLIACFRREPTRLRRPHQSSTGDYGSPWGPPPARQRQSAARRATRGSPD